MNQQSILKLPLHVPFDNVIECNFTVIFSFEFCLEFLNYSVLCLLVTGLQGCSASRGMKQTFSCLSKLGGTTNLIRLLFGHVK